MRSLLLPPYAYVTATATTITTTSPPSLILSSSSLSWQLQLLGRKRWHICSPAQDLYMYGAGVVDTLAPDYEAFPDFESAWCYGDVVSPGEILYYPESYWHQTRTLDSPTVSLTGTLVTTSNYRSVRRELEKECSGAGRVMTPEAGVCDALKRCYAVWEKRFGDADDDGTCAPGI